jgi:hypothetical protein
MALARSVIVQNRSIRVWLALICAAAVVCPILSASDELNTDDAAIMVPAVLAAVSLAVIALLSTIPTMPAVVHIATPSDPRSPPAR